MLKLFTQISHVKSITIRIRQIRVFNFMSCRVGVLLLEFFWFGLGSGIGMFFWFKSGSCIGMILWFGSGIEYLY